MFLAMRAHVSLDQQLRRVFVCMFYNRVNDLLSFLPKVYFRSPAFAAKNDSEKCT